MTSRTDQDTPIISTVGENTAVGGIKNAYRAGKVQYPKSFVDGEEFVLPGVNYTRSCARRLALCEEGNHRGERRARIRRGRAYTH